MINMIENLSYYKANVFFNTKSSIATEMGTIPVNYQDNSNPKESHA